MFHRPLVQHGAEKQEAEDGNLSRSFPAALKMKERMSNPTVRQRAIRAAATKMVIFTI